MKYSIFTFLLVFFVTTLGFAQKQQARITVKGTQFFKGDQPYAYIGANYWYGSMLAS